MKKIIVGDVHGCADELNEIILKTKFSLGSDILYLTGDAFARGPNPLGVWQTIVKSQAKMVLGNHDVRLREQLGMILANKDPGPLKADQYYTICQLESVHTEVFDWLSNCPLFIKNKQFLLVHAGINPILGLSGTSFDEFISIRTWPNKIKSLEGQRWHDFYKKMHPLLIFGHDAPNGLVEKKDKGNTYLIGLDTGCVYGGKLTAYSITEETLIQVDSKK